MSDRGPLWLRVCQAVGSGVAYRLSTAWVCLLVAVWAGCGCALLVFVGLPLSLIDPDLGGRFLAWVDEELLV